MIALIAIAIALPGFNDIGRSVIFFLFFWWIIFSTDFQCLAKRKKIYLIEFLIFAKCSIEFPFLALRLFVWLFQMPLKGLGFVKTLVKFRIIYATDQLLQIVKTPVDQAELSV